MLCTPVEISSFSYSQGAHQEARQLRMYPSTSKASTSAMKPYIEGLRILKILGLPLKICEQDDGSIVFKDNLRWVKCGVIICKKDHQIKSNQI